MHVCMCVCMYCHRLEVGLSESPTAWILRHNNMHVCLYICMCVCVCMYCARARVRACVRACVYIASSIRYLFATTASGIFGCRFCLGGGLLPFTLRGNVLGLNVFVLIALESAQKPLRPR